MTLQQDIIQLLMESAPVDPYNDEGARTYRVAAIVGRGARRRHRVELTREHDSEEAAMHVLADKVRYAANDMMLMSALAEINVLQGRITALEQQLADTKKRRR